MTLEEAKKWVSFDPYIGIFPNNPKLTDEEITEKAQKFLENYKPWKIELKPIFEMKNDPPAAKLLDRVITGQYYAWEGGHYSFVIQKGTPNGYLLSGNEYSPIDFKQTHYFQMTGGCICFYDKI